MLGWIAPVRRRRRAVPQLVGRGRAARREPRWRRPRPRGDAGRRCARRARPGRRPDAADLLHRLRVLRPGPRPVPGRTAPARPGSSSTRIRTGRGSSATWDGCWRSSPPTRPPRLLAVLDDVEAVVLVGGKGTRLRPLTLSAAKPMLPTAGVPFLAHLLSRIRAAGVRRVVLGTSYLAETFEAGFGDGAALDLELIYVTEARAAGHRWRHPQRRRPPDRRDRHGLQRRRARRHRPHAPSSTRTGAPTPTSRCTWCACRTRARSAACRPTPTAASGRSSRRPRIRRPTRSTPVATSSAAR